MPLDFESFTISRKEESFIESLVGESRDIRTSISGPQVILFEMASNAPEYVNIDGSISIVAGTGANALWNVDRLAYFIAWENIHNIIPNLDLRVIIMKNQPPEGFEQFHRLSPDPPRATFDDLPDLEIFPSASHIPPVEEFVSLITQGRALQEKPFFVAVLDGAQASTGADSLAIGTRLLEVTTQLETVNGWGPFNQGSPTLFRRQGATSRYLDWMIRFMDLAVRAWTRLNP